MMEKCRISCSIILVLAILSNEVMFLHCEICFFFFFEKESELFSSCFLGDYIKVNAILKFILTLSGTCTLPLKYYQSCYVSFP